MATRKELIEAVGVRYREARPSERTRILDELVALAGYHRKHAIRLLAEPVECAQAAPTRNRLYDKAVRQALIVLWEAADRICGKRLKVLIPILVEAMERHGHLQLAPVIRAKLLQVSAATIDRALSEARRPSTASASAARASARRRGDSPQHSGAHLRRLARPADWVLRSRHGRALRRPQDRGAVKNRGGPKRHP